MGKKKRKRTSETPLKQAAFLLPRQKAENITNDDVYFMVDGCIFQNGILLYRKGKLGWIVAKSKGGIYLSSPDADYFDKIYVELQRS